MKKFRDISLVLFVIGTLVFLISVLADPSLFAFKVALLFMLPFDAFWLFNKEEELRCSLK